MARYQSMRGQSCWLCGRNGTADPLDRHHIFGGSNRDKSDRLGLVVPLCHSRCHENGPEAVHRNRETMQKLHEYGQKLAMERFGWTIEEFRLEFGRNYLPLERPYSPEYGAATRATPLEDSGETSFSNRNDEFRFEEEEPGESFEYSRLAAVLGIRPGDEEEEDEIA